MTVAMKGRYDAIVVGAGHNGLTAAYYLAAAGLSVVVLERRESVGGLCSTEEVWPGFKNNVGANSAHNVDPKIVHDMKLESHGLKWAQRNPSAIMAFPDGGLYVGWQDRKRSVDQIEKFGRGDSEGYFRLLAELDQLGEALDVSYYEPPPTWDRLTSRLTTRELEDTFRKVMFGSATNLLADRIRSPLVQATLGMIGVSGNFIAPSTPGSAFMLFTRPLYRGSRAARRRSRGNVLGTGPRSPVGGMGAITAAMARSVEARAGEIYTGVAVDQVLCRDGKASGVVLADGRTVEAPVVVSNASPKATLLNLIPEGVLPSSTVERAREIRMGGSVFKVLLALDGLPRFNGSSSAAEDELFGRCGFRMAPSIQSMDRAYQQAVEGGWSTEPMIWGLMPSTMDPTMAPPGKHVMSLTTFHAPYELAEGSWEVEREKFGRQVIKHLGEYMPNLDSYILDYRFLSPVDLEDEYGLMGASQTHGDVTPGQMFSMRPMVGCSEYRTPVAGLYMCSVGTWPAYYVSGLPGHNAAHQIIADLGNGRRNHVEEVGDEQIDALEAAAAPVDFAPS